MQDFPPGITDFIRSNFIGIEQLRIFVLLRKTPDRKWDLEGLSRILHVPTEVIEKHLQQMAVKGFVNRLEGGQYQYKKIPSQEPMREEVVEMDRRRPVTLIQLVYSLMDAAKHPGNVDTSDPK